MGWVRRFNGKVFHTAGRVMNKRDAKELAQHRRERGTCTRVVRVKGGYVVFNQVD